MTKTTAPLSFGEKLGYGLGDTASNLYLQFWGFFLLYYLTDVYGLAPAVVATILLVTKVVDAVTDPAMGLIADRTRSRWGRYRGYLLWGPVPYAIVGYLLFAGPDLSDTGKIIWVLVMYSAVMLGYTAINVPYSALMGVISPLASERTKVTTFRFACASAATLIISATVTPLKNWLGGGDEVLGFRLTILLFSVLSVLLFWITFATTKERIEPIERTSRVREELKDLLTNRSWLVLVAAGILMLVGVVVRGSTAVFYFKYHVGDDGSLIWFTFDATALFLSSGAAAQFLGVLTTSWLSARFEKRRLMMVLAAIFVVFMGVFYVTPPDNFGAMVASNAVAMFMFGPVIALLFAMYTDCAEYSEWKTGNQVTGLVVAASMFSLKFGSAVGAAIPGYVLDWVGFVPNVDQTGSTIQGIRILMSGLPALFFGLGGLAFVFYQLDREAMATVEEDLAERRGDEAVPVAG